MIQIGYAALWWLMVLVLGLVTFPLVSRLCGRLQDRGYCISKVLGLLLATYLSWLLGSAHILKFGYANIAVSLALLAALSLYIGRRHLTLRNIPWRSMLLSEALFAAAFVLFLLVISHKIDFTVLWSEDFMDFGFLNSILRSDYFPPADPWLAGESMPYYYGGHMASAFLVMLSRVPPSIAYNLAVAMFFALAISTAFGVGYNATRRKLFGLVAVAFVCLAGFISGAFQLAAFFKQQPVMGYNPLDVPSINEWFLSFDFVHANRVIGGAVNHYPYYAYLVGDMHANVMDIPFQLMFITLALSLLGRGESAASGPRADTILKVLILGLSLGFLLFVNTWSYPVYLGFFILAFIFLKLDLNWKGLVGVIGVSLLAYLPYLLSRGSGTIQGLGLVDDSTDLIEFVEIFALFLFAMVSLMLVLFRDSLFTRRAFMIGAIGMFVVALVAFLVHFQLILLLAPLIMVPLYYICRSGSRGELHFMLLLALTGALVLLFFEVVFINDALGPPNERYNTLLKIYMPVWVVWGIASSYGVYWVLRNLKGVLRMAWAFLLLLLVLSALIHPLAATTSWASGRYALVEGSGLTLDGLAYLESTNPGELEAVRWLNENVDGSHVILEAPGVAMKYSSPASAFTGLPTLLGWQGWEVMWGRSWDITSQRERAIDAIYENPGSEDALVLLDYYDVEYVYVGALEKRRYGEQTSLEFARQPEIFSLVHEGGGVSIYKMIR